MIKLLLIKENGFGLENAKMLWSNSIWVKRKKLKDVKIFSNRPF